MHYNFSINSVLKNFSRSGDKDGEVRGMNLWFPDNSGEF